MLFCLQFSVHFQGIGCSFLTVQSRNHRNRQNSYRYIAHVFRQINNGEVASRSRAGVYKVLLRAERRMRGYEAERPELRTGNPLAVNVITIRFLMNIIALLVWNPASSRPLRHYGDYNLVRKPVGWYVQFKSSSLIWVSKTFASASCSTHMPSLLRKKI